MERVFVVKSGMYGEIRGSVLNPLQLQAVEVGICPFCHKKSLERVMVRVVSDHVADECVGCGRIFFSPGDKP